MNIGDFLNLRPYNFIIHRKENPNGPKIHKGTERSDMIKQFMDLINKEREGTKFKKVNYITINMKLTHLSLNDLYYFMSECKDYKNRHGSFSKCFFGALKVK